MPETDRVLGNSEKLSAAMWQETRAAFDVGSSPKAIVNDIMSVRHTAPHLVESFSGRCRAFVQVQNGCDHRCTFCIIPYGRGNSRSVPMGAVVADVERLVANNYNEIVLTGVDLTSYGGDLPGTPKLGTLVKQILRHVPELKRLRLSSIDSIEADRDLIDAFAQQDRLMPHLHLSLQAGDDLILKRMKRRHARGDAIDFCRLLRSVRPDVVFGADIIAGFPTETEEHVCALARSGRRMRTDFTFTCFHFRRGRERRLRACRSLIAALSKSARKGCALMARWRCAGISKPRQASRGAYCWNQS